MFYGFSTAVARVRITLSAPRGTAFLPLAKFCRSMGKNQHGSISSPLCNPSWRFATYVSATNLERAAKFLRPMAQACR
jgi:hypothetical protein